MSDDGVDPPLGLLEVVGKGVLVPPGLLIGEGERVADGVLVLAGGME